MRTYVTRWHTSNSHGNLPVAFISLYSRMAVRAKELGYALCLHASAVVSECDIVAVPWDERAVHPRVLIESLLELCGVGFVIPEETDLPHGRRTWQVVMDGDATLTFDVFPIRPRKTPEKSIKICNN